ncbi:MAG: hypothetical protein QXU82_01580 [Candidatus Aenigmatarchaeota archaeon]
MIMEVAREAWRAYKRNFRTLLVAVIIYFGIIYAIMGLGFALFYMLGQTAISAALMMAFFAISILVSYPLAGGLFKMCLDALGKGARVGTMFRAARERWQTFIGIGLLFAAIVLIPILLMMAPIMMMGSAYSYAASAAIMMILAMIVGYVLIIILTLLLSFSFPAAVVDNLRAVEAVKRSYNFAKPRFLSVFALFIIILIMMAAIAIPFIVAAFFIFIFLGPMAMLVGVYIAFIVGMFAASPLQYLALTSFYIKNRKSVKKSKGR